MIYLYVSRSKLNYQVVIVCENSENEFCIKPTEFGRLMAKLVIDYVTGAARFMPSFLPFGFIACYVDKEKDHVRGILRDGGIDGNALFGGKGD